MKSVLQNNDIETCSTYNEGKSVIKKVIKKIVNLKLVVLLEYQNIKIILQKFTLHIGLKKFLWLKILKILYPGLIL